MTMYKELREKIEEMANGMTGSIRSPHEADLFSQGAQAAVKLLDERNCVECKYYSYAEDGDPISWCDYLDSDLHCVSPQTFSCKRWSAK